MSTIKIFQLDDKSVCDYIKISQIIGLSFNGSITYIYLLGGLEYYLEHGHDKRNLVEKELTEALETNEPKKIGVDKVSGRNYGFVNQIENCLDKIETTICDK
ncbi:MAG: hypothetical protein AAF208_13570 [Cyanobacteria bacterium P01_A01_bin.45]